MTPAPPGSLSWTRFVLAVAVLSATAPIHRFWQHQSDRVGDAGRSPPPGWPAVVKTDRRPAKSPSSRYYSTEAADQAVNLSAKLLAR
jgi:hypothetical protein